MEAESGEFRDDWEMLSSSEPEPEIEMDKSSFLDEDLREFDGLGDWDSKQGINIRSDYFSIDFHQKYREIVATTGDDVDSNRMDSCSESLPIETKGLVGSLLDSSSDRRVDREFVDSGLEKELTFVDKSFCFDEILTLGEDDSSKLSGSGEARSVMEFGDEGKGTEMELGDDKEIGQSIELLGEENGKTDESNAHFEGETRQTPVENEAGMENGSLRVAKLDEEEERKKVVWWKLPLEILKYSLFKGSSVWSVSMGVAMMGLLLLGRSFYKMRSRRRSLQLKVTVDDKKVSQFMQSAARLNEAFSVVRRAPAIRPLLPLTGATPWPAMNLR